jgi:predicted transposase YbfD/YdcC
MPLAQAVGSGKLERGSAVCGSRVRACVVANDQKCNEITAIPQLREILDISAVLLTIDAMGCHAEIAQEDRRQHGRLCAACQAQPAGTLRHPQ